MAAETFIEAEVWSLAQTDQGNVVLVRPKGSDLAVPIFIGALETQGILIGLGGVEVPRPLTHDLILTILETVQARLDRVEINGLREGTFYARLVLAWGEAEYLVDCRPSDALGVAVRRHCPVFIAESVVDEAGISVNLVTEGGRVAESPGPQPSPAGEAGPGGASTTPIQPVSSSPAKAALQAALERAIETEDYEKAARLRDMLKGLGD